ncbi:MAG: prepilin-type N-terminal cleavage/methylation domain-containing protein [Desulfobacteraceae bacterium]|jgi:prepilin-type N-terminal cleavage/methylation domain-containing protein
MFKMVKRNEKGFTLIELMIVIAIIGILAAIAVPQFMTYRMRAYNSAAKATGHNLKADNANLNSELGVYGHTEAAAVLLDGADAGVGVADTTADVDLARPSTIGATGARLAGTTGALPARSLAIGVALGNNMIADVQDVNDATNQSSYCAYTRHFKGDTAYGIDGDIENSLYAVTNANWSDVAGIGAATLVPTLPPVDDITGQAGGGLPTGNWTLVP